MNVRLLSHSQPTEEFASMGIEDAQDIIHDLERALQ